MITTLPAEVRAYFQAATSSFLGLGDVRYAYDAERDISLRERAAKTLDSLGAWDLDIRGDADELLAAAELCRAAGAAVLPYPVVPHLLATDAGQLALVDPAVPRIDHGDLGSWIAADLDGNSWAVTTERHPSKLGPFMTHATLGTPGSTVAASDIDLALALTSCLALGAVERALALVCEHVAIREQFGKPLASFQSVRFAIADAVVGVKGLSELTLFTLSRTHATSADVRRADALLLRLKACDTVRSTMRTCHQLLGAVGFCDEHDVSVLDRHIQSTVRNPVGPEAITELLMPAIKSGHLETLFSASTSTHR